jgi:hypothetical protein
MANFVLGAALRAVFTRVLGRVGLGIAVGTPIAQQVARSLQNARIAEMIKAAGAQYPNLAGKYQNHHIWPQYLGGPKNGPTWRIDAAYHQVITNAFRSEWKYGGVPPSAAKAREIMIKVYQEFPLW